MNITIPAAVVAAILVVGGTLCAILGAVLAAQALENLHDR